MKKTCALVLARLDLRGVMSLLESALLMILAAILSGLAIRVWSGKKYISCQRFDREQSLLQKQIDNIWSTNEKQYQQINSKLDTQFSMLRSIVLHLNIDDDKKAKILNTNGERRRY